MALATKWKWTLGLAAVFAVGAGTGLEITEVHDSLPDTHPHLVPEAGNLPVCMDPSTFNISANAPHPNWAITVGAEPVQLRALPYPASEVHLPTQALYVQMTDEQGRIAKTIVGLGPKLDPDGSWNINTPGPYLRFFPGTADAPDPMQKNDPHENISGAYEHGPGYPVFVAETEEELLERYIAILQTAITTNGREQVFGAFDNGNSAVSTVLHASGLNYPSKLYNESAVGVENVYERDAVGLAALFVEGDKTCGRKTDLTIDQLRIWVGALERVLHEQIQKLAAQGVDADLPGVPHKLLEGPPLN